MLLATLSDKKKEYGDVLPFALHGLEGGTGFIDGVGLEYGFLRPVPS
jgi:hypothetical protein